MQRYSASYDQWRIRFLEDGDPAPVLAARTAFADSLVLEAWQSVVEPSVPGAIALLAVGGYGRRELFPHSDIDLLILNNQAIESPEAKAALSSFLRSLWDAGLRISQSVHTVDDCSTVTEGNFELTVSLLDRRFLAGDSTLYAALNQRFDRFLRAERNDLARRLARMARSRHARFHNSIYRLEPDLKEAPGGLRDLQTIHWLALLSGSPSASLDDPEPRRLLESARCFLHFESGRDNNLLSFEAQDSLAAASFSRVPDPAEWMRGYYRAASRVFGQVQRELETCESSGRRLLEGFFEWRGRLSNSDFTVSRGLVLIKNPHELDTGLALALRLFLFVARHGLPPARATAERISARIGAWSDRLASYPLQPVFWRDLLGLRYSTVALRAMRDTGFLALALPGWARIDHLVVRDYYHHYTVDEHTLVALESLDALTTAKEPATARLAELAEECAERMWLLRLALLLHDIGKGSGRDHTQEALRLSSEFLLKCGARQDDAEAVLFLIRHHLSLSAALQTRDLDDPATAAALAALVKTVENLRLLILMTYADVSAVNPTAMTEWRIEQLWRLYRTVYRHLTGDLTSSTGATAREVYGDLSLLLEEFLDGLPQRYFWTHPKQQAAAHAALYDLAKTARAAIAVERRDGAWHAAVVAADRPFLFASLAGALSSFGLNILKADAFTNRHGFAADTFVFVDPNRSLDLNPPEVERLKSVLRRVAFGQARVEDLLKNRPVKPPPGRNGTIRPSVSADNEASPNATVFEVVAHDRPGLLYALASAISRAGCNIEVVLVATEAHKAIDVFHVTQSGQKLSAVVVEPLRQALLGVC